MSVGHGRLRACDVVGQMRRIMRGSVMNCYWQDESKVISTNGVAIVDSEHYLRISFQLHFARNCQIARLQSNCCNCQPPVTSRLQVAKFAAIFTSNLWYKKCQSQSHLHEVHSSASVTSNYN